MPSLFLQQADKNVLEIPLDRDRVVLGRSAHCHFRLDAKSVSAQHALIMRHAGEVVVSDLGSTNGTRINGRRIKQPRVLKHGDQIKIGEAMLVYFARGGNAAEPADAGSQPLVRSGGKVVNTANAFPQQISNDQSVPVAWNGSDRRSARRDEPLPETTRSAYVSLLSGPRSGARFPLQKESTTLGQDGALQFVLRRAGARYLAMPGEGGGLPSVNGVTILPRGVILEHGDVVELGGAKVRFEFGDTTSQEA